MNLLQPSFSRSLLLTLALVAPTAWAVEGAITGPRQPAKVEADKPELPRRWDRLERGVTERVAQKAKPKAPFFPAERS